MNLVRDIIAFPFLVAGAACLLIGFWLSSKPSQLPTNDASRTLLHGSNRKTGVLVPLYLIAALLTLASGICGCSVEQLPSDHVDAKAAQLMSAKTLGAHGSLWVSEVEIDGEKYIVVNSNNGQSPSVAICPKTKPEVQP